MVFMRCLPGAWRRRACPGRARSRSRAVPPGPRRARASSGGRSGAHRRRGLAIPPDAVVFDRHAEPGAVPREPDPGAIGRGVLAHVGERLLDDPDGLDLRRGRERAERTVGDLELDGDPVLRAELVQVLGEGGNEPEPARDEGAEAEDRLAHLLVGAPRRCSPSRAGPRRRPARRAERARADCSFMWSRPSAWARPSCISRARRSRSSTAARLRSSSESLARSMAIAACAARPASSSASSAVNSRSSRVLTWISPIGVVPQPERGDEVRARVLGTDDRTDRRRPKREPGRAGTRTSAPRCPPGTPRGGRSSPAPRASPPAGAKRQRTTASPRSSSRALSTTDWRMRSTCWRREISVPMR